MSRRKRLASVSAEAEILRKYHKIAVVGLSSDEARESHGVAAYMQAAGYRIVPVNPAETEVLGEKAYPTVASIPATVEIVNVFRRSEAVPGVVDDAIAAGAKVIWMQEGIVNEEAAAKARQAGLEVVMDRCIRSEHRRMAASV
ncbi:MAG: CoA-binding protein [Chloroflexi bacterium]|nr:CoA-binding protein [Chloroflexota bacterium]MCI0819326.1 CoA-binding protein [Chloroflexota bacterium]MCI0832471.1 CoA-binding protein [Chloroflexota bacterium]MCI0883705.1 CoA-binding protein [Chloroflexota bacterium]